MRYAIIIENTKSNWNEIVKKSRARLHMILDSTRGYIVNRIYIVWGKGKASFTYYKNKLRLKIESTSIRDKCYVLDLDGRKKNVEIREFFFPIDRWKQQDVH